MENRMTASGGREVSRWRDWAKWRKDSWTWTTVWWLREEVGGVRDLIGNGKNTVKNEKKKKKKKKHLSHNNNMNPIGNQSIVKNLQSILEQKRNLSSDSCLNWYTFFFLYLVLLLYLVLSVGWPAELTPVYDVSGLPGRQCTQLFLTAIWPSLIPSKPFSLGLQLSSHASREKQSRTLLWTREELIPVHWRKVRVWRLVLVHWLAYGQEESFLPSAKVIKQYPFLSERQGKS